MSVLTPEQLEKVASAMMDSDDEKASHERMMAELKSIFEEPLKRLDAITEEEWNQTED